MKVLFSLLHHPLDQELLREFQEDHLCELEFLLGQRERSTAPFITDFISPRTALILALIDLVEQYAPGFASRIQGASSEELHRLEEQLRHPLPNSYKDFLSLMGKDLGGFETPQVDLRLERVQDFYEVTEPQPPHRFIFIGAHDEDPYMDYYLDCRMPTGSQCPVIRAESPEQLLKPEKLWRSFASLEDMLFVWAFRNRLSRLGHRRKFSPALQRNSQGMMVIPPGILGSVEALAARLGFQKLPHTSPLTLLFERGDAALYLSRPTPEGGITSELAAQDSREFRKVEEAITDNTALL